MLKVLTNHYLFWNDVLIAYTEIITAVLEVWQDTFLLPLLLFEEVHNPKNSQKEKKKNEVVNITGKRAR